MHWTCSPLCDKARENNNFEGAPCKERMAKEEKEEKHENPKIKLQSREKEETGFVKNE